MLKLATMKANEKATLPANVEGMASCDYAGLSIVYFFMSLLFVDAELTVTDYAELLSSEPSKKVY